MPLLAITLTGLYTNLVFNGIDLFVECGLLVVISAIGFAFRRVWWVALFFVCVFGGYEIQHYVRAPFPFSIQERWPELLLAFGSMLLNAYLFHRYAGWQGLWHTESSAG